MEFPGVGVPLHEGGDDEELDDAEEAGVGGDGEPRRVLLQHGGLEHQPAGPRQAVPDQVHATQRPVLLAGGHGHGHLLQLELVAAAAAAAGAEDGGALVERDDGRTRHARQRPGHLGHAVAPVQPDLLDPQRRRHGEGDCRHRVLDRRRERRRRVVQPQQVEPLVRRDADDDDDDINHACVCVHI